MKIYVIAGEASGDLHASNLAKALLKQQPSLSLRGWGGDEMSAAGVEVVKHYRELAFMGFSEVIANLGTILSNFKSCKADIEQFAPDILVLVDYPGFNLRMAKWAKAKGIRVVYYISPQVWAWKASRTEKIRKYVDQMLVILPFEKAWFAERKFDVSFVGHPLLDVAMGSTAKREDQLILLVPGSRSQEIERMLPIMLEATKNLQGYKRVIAGAPSQSPDMYKRFAPNDVDVVFGETRALMQRATAGLVTSGTATLEAALSGMPEVVMYKGSAISYAIAKRLVKVKYISLVNLILDREAVKELIQNECTAAQAKTCLERLLPGESDRGRMLSHYTELRQALGGGGASERAASEILNP